MAALLFNLLVFAHVEVSGARVCKSPYLSSLNVPSRVQLCGMYICQKYCLDLFDTHTFL